MVTIVTRAGKGSPLTNTELDANFNNLNAAIIAGGVSGYLRTSFNATAGQTSFTFTYTPPYVLVWVNGVLLSAADYTATSGTVVVLATTCAVGDVVELVALSSGAGGGAGTVTSVAPLQFTTTGTDVSSSVASPSTTPVITLNLPTASATSRGALSSTDWTTFNSKQAPLVSGTNIKTLFGTTILGSGDAGLVPATYGGTGLSAPGTSGNVLMSNGTTWVSSAPTTTFTPSTINTVTGVSSTLAASYSNRKVVEAQDYGVVVGSSAVAATNSTIINNLMAGLSARGGGILQLPPGDIYIASTLDNKYPRVQVWGAGTESFHDSGSPTFGTRLRATIATTMLKLRTPYAAEQGIAVANTWKYTGGGFKYLSLNGEGVATKALLIDSVSFVEVDVFATNFNAAEFYTLQCGITYSVAGGHTSDANLGEACDIQFSKITLRARAIDTTADKAATICRLMGSANANVSLNRLPEYGISVYAQHWSGNVLTADSADNNDITLIGVRAGGTGYLAYMKGPTSTPDVPTGGDSNNLYYVSGGGAIYAQGTDTAGVLSGVKNRITNYDNGNGTPEPTAGTGSIWAFTRMTDNVHANEPAAKLAIADYANDAGPTRTSMGSESLRIRNSASNHVRLTDTVNEWGVNIDGTNGDLRFNRVAGTGTVSFGGIALPAASGGTGLTAPGTSGNVLTSNGTGWVSSAPSGGGAVTSVAGRTGAVVLTAADATYTTSGTGGTAITTQAKFQQTVSVKDFGAVGNNVTNDTTALQNAINSGAGILVWPAGTYLVNGTGLTGVSNQIWVGQGAGSTIIKLTANTTGAYFVQWASKSKWGIKDLTFDMNGFTSTSPGPPTNPSIVLDLFACTDFVVEDCRFLKMPQFGVSLNACSRFTLRGNYVEKTTITHDHNEALLVGNFSGATTDGKILNNTFVNSGTDFMGSNHLIQGNTIRGWGMGAGITVEEDANTYDLIIDSNVITGGNGQDASGGTGTGTWSSGIENWSPRCIISNNTIFANDGSGIDNGGGYSVVTGNIVYDNGRGAANLKGISSRQSGNAAANNASFSVYSNNKCYDTSATTYGQTYGYSDETFITTFTGNGTVGTGAGPFVFSGVTLQIYDTSKPKVTVGGVLKYPFVDYTIYANANQLTSPGGYIVFNVAPGSGVAVTVETSPFRFITLAGNDFRNNRTAPTYVLSTGVHGHYPTLQSSLSYDPPSLAPGGTGEFDVFAYAARIGDFAQVSFSLDTQGVVFSGRVNADNNVRVRMVNPTGSAIDLASGIVRVMLTKPENYANV